MHPCFLSMILIATCFCVLHSESMRLVEIATNPQGYRVHAVVVLKCYTPDKNQATTTRYHISDHNFNLDILLLYGQVIGNVIYIFMVRLRASILQYSLHYRFLWQPTTTMPMYIMTCNPILISSAFAMHTTHANEKVCSRPHINSQHHKCLSHTVLRPGLLPLTGECPSCSCRLRLWLEIPLTISG